MRQRTEKKSAAEEDDDDIAQIKVKKTSFNIIVAVFSDSLISFHLFTVALLKIVLPELKKKPALGDASMTGIA